MDTKVIIYETNDSDQLDLIITILNDNNIDLVINENRNDQILGYVNSIYRYEIFVAVDQEDKAFNLINELTANNNIEAVISENKKKKYETVSDYYNDIFIKFDNKSTYKNMTWNWAAFFFTWIWYIYHKMYLYAFLTLVLIIGVSFLGSLPSHILHLGISVYVGIYGNYDKYQKYINKNA